MGKKTKNWIAGDLRTKLQTKQKPSENLGEKDNEETKGKTLLLSVWAWQWRVARESEVSTLSYLKKNIVR